MLELDRIYNMDCIEGMKLIDDNSIDMVLCDLPFGITACDWDKPICLNCLWKEYKRISKKNTPIILTSIQPYTTKLINSNRDWFKYDLIWNKVCATGALLAYKRPMRVHENILIFYEKQTTYNPQYIQRKIKDLRSNKKITKRKNPCKSGKITSHNINKHSENYNDRRVNPISIITFNKRNSKYLHPTQKPLKLFEYLIKTYSDEGDLVLDNCMGSGTTAVACKRLNRHFIGFEINKKYYDISLQRLLNVPERLANWIES